MSDQSQQRKKSPPGHAEQSNTQTHFQAAAEGSLAGIYVIKEGKFDYVNPSFGQIFGYEPVEIIGRLSPSHLVHPDDREKVNEFIRRRVEGEVESMRYTFRGLRKDASTLRCEVLGRVINPGQNASIVGTLLDITEREIAREALVESEAKFRGLAEESPGMIFILRGDRVLYANQACLDILGYSLSQLMDDRISFFELLKPESVEHVKTYLTRQMEARDIPSFEYCMRTKRGEFVNVIQVSRLIQYEGDLAILGIVTDITDRKRMEEELRRTNRALRTLSACNQTVVRATSEEGLMLEICRNIVEIGGYPLAWVGFAELDDPKTIRPVAQWGEDAGYLESLTLTWADTVDGSSPTGIAIRTGEAAIAEDIQHDVQFERWRTAALETGCNSWIALPMTVEEQVIGALNIHSNDMGEFGSEELDLLVEIAGDLAFGIEVLRVEENRRLVTAALKQSEARYKGLFDTLLEGFALHEIICDEDGVPRDYRFLEINPAFEQITGLRAAEVIGKTVREVIPGIEAHWIDTYGQVALTGQPVQFENHSQELGKYFEVIAFSPEEGQFATLFMDITERRHIEQARRELNRQKDEFVVSLSHGLRSPLHTLQGFLELLREGKVEESEVREDFLKRASLDSERIETVVNDLVDAFQLETGRIQLVKEEMDIADLLQECLHLMAGDAEEKGVNLGYGEPGETAILVGNRPRLRQVVLDLLENAIRVSSPGDRVTITSQLEGDKVRIQIADEGIGLSQEALRSIIDEPSGEREVGEGTAGAAGLGIYLAKRILNAHGGRLEAESTLGEGSTFHIILPLDDTDPE